MHDSVDTSVDTLAQAVIALAAQTTATVDCVADVVNAAADVVAAQAAQAAQDEQKQKQEQIEFRHIPGLLNYFCDQSGRIWRSTSKSIKEVKPIRNPVSGYMGINIQLPCGKWTFTSGGIHKLIAQAWYGPAPDGKPYVNHRDGNRANNIVSNLEYVSPFVNAQGNPATPPYRRSVPVYDMASDVHYRSLSAAARATRQGVRTIKAICDGERDGMFVYDEPGAIRYWLTHDESCKKGDLV